MMGKLLMGLHTSTRSGTARGSRGRRSATPFKIGLSVAMCFVYLVGQAPAASAHIPIPPDTGLEKAPDVGVPGGNQYNPAWTREPIANGTVLMNSSLQSDADGALAVAYYDQLTGDLMYARQIRDGAWSIETVDSEGNVGSFPSLALLQDGTPAISYYDSTNFVLKYATMSGSAWTTRIVDPTLKRGVTSSLAITPSGAPAIAYTGSDNGVYYAQPNGSTWTIQTVDTTQASAVSLGFDPQGIASVVYSKSIDSTRRALQYAQPVAGKWKPTTVDSGGTGLGRMLALRFTSTGKPMIAYADWTGSFSQWSAKLASLTSSAWVMQTVVPGNVQMISLTLDDQDCPALFYNTISPASLKVARSDCQSWTTQTLDNGVRFYPSAGTDAQGNPLVAYSELNTPTPGLRLARAGVDPCALPLGVNDFCSTRTHPGDPSPPPVADGPLLTPHPPIVIDGDASLPSPTSGVTNPLAAGTAEDPYIIEGWSIAAPPATNLARTGAGILVRGTSKHIVIRNVGVSKLDDLHSVGVRLTNASNVRLEDTRITGTFVGRVGITTQDITLFGGAGVVVDGASHDITIQRNTLKSGFSAIEIAEGSFGILVQDNTIVQFSGFGIYAVNAGKDILVTKNKITDTSYGLVSHKTEGARFTNNSVNLGYLGIILDNANGTLVSGNTLTDNIHGAFVYYSDQGSWSNNSMFHTFFSGIVMEASSQNIIEDSVFMDSGSQGIWAYAGRPDGKPSSANQFRNNDFRGNVSFAMNLKSTPGSVIESNAFCLSSGTAISLTTSADTTISRNNFTLYTKGLAAGSSSNVAAINNWWGNQGGPGAAGASSVSGAATVAPWLDSPNPDAGSSADKCSTADLSPVPVVPEAQPWLIGLAATLIAGFAVRRRLTAPAPAAG